MAASFESRGQIGVITISDPIRRNALSNQLVSECLTALSKSKAAGVRAIVIISAEKMFCAGADLKDMQESDWLNSAQSDPTVVNPVQLFEAIQTDSRPVIAVVDGLALGGGVELLLSCDIVIAGPGASFAFPEIGLGVIPNTAMALLPAIVGRRAALELILTRRRIDAEEALRLGLVNEVLASDELLERAVSIASGIVQSAPPVAIAAVKRGTSSTPDWERVRTLLSSMDEREWRAGLTAFASKSKPDYDAFWAESAAAAAQDSE